MRMLVKKKLGMVKMVVENKMPMTAMGNQMAMMMVMGMELAARCVLPTQEATVH